MASLVRTRRSASLFRGSFAGAPMEISLLRSSMGALEAGRRRCVHCHRTPLVGELVHVYTATGGERLVCALCRSRHKEPPVRTEIVHSDEHQRAVKARPGAA
jgi:hypothetical protein